MNRVEFEVVDVVRPEVGGADPDAVETVRQLTITVDGVPLEALARPVELPFASADGQAELAGRYQALQDLRVCWPSRHFLDEPFLSESDDGDAVLMGCICGDPGCWPLSADIGLDDHTVTWSRFNNVHRPHWDHSALGPFVFDRAQYEAALRRTRQE
ncbi:hypothetical protein K3N28_12285 [Glycomyces sp. TRM65418]|uniref:hypothetical protein n=1 Tax=Glycomyces sp. TRM65418 TaxID=2867006 RepID=UPI001CE5CF4A|nr:hypothetical protein [Glycomyces sp. TRM65418]MCC3763844.1 hypothetical protein [Glycomyces sp. TRM65418]QZD53548.1 hypothetical protein K3N28_12215 [Glycomyces sp. TRM65418]